MPIMRCPASLTTMEFLRASTLIDARLCTGCLTAINESAQIGTAIESQYPKDPASLLGCVLAACPGGEIGRRKGLKQY